MFPCYTAKINNFLLWVCCGCVVRVLCVCCVCVGLVSAVSEVRTLQEHAGQSHRSSGDQEEVGQTALFMGQPQTPENLSLHDVTIFLYRLFSFVCMFFLLSLASRSPPSLSLSLSLSLSFPPLFPHSFLHFTLSVFPFMRRQRHSSPSPAKVVATATVQDGQGAGQVGANSSAVSQV